MSKSAGFYKELAYLALSRDLLVLASDTIPSDSKYKANEELNDKLKLLQEKLETFLLTYIRDFPKVNIQLDKLLKVIQMEEIIQPDFLAIFLIFARFLDHRQGRILDNDLSWIKNETQFLYDCEDLIRDIISDEFEYKTELLATKLAELL